MTDFSFFGMIVGIIVIGFGIMAYCGIKVLEFVLTPIAKLVQKKRDKDNGHYDLPASPKGFFTHYYKAYYNELILGNHHRIPYGKDRKFIESVNGFDKYDNPEHSPYEIVAMILAANKEVERGFRPSYYPLGYPKYTKDLWACLRVEFKEKYDFYTGFIERGDEKVLDDVIYNQKQREEDYNRRFKIDPTKDVEDFFIE